MDFINIQGHRRAFDILLYVDPVNGVDSTGRGSVDSPLKTMRYAIDRMPTAGGAIFLMGYASEGNINLGSKSITFIGDYFKYGSRWQLQMHYLKNCTFIGLYLEQLSTGTWAEMFYYGYGTNSFHNCIVNDRSGYSNVHYYDFVYYNCFIINFGDTRYADTKFFRCMFVDANSYHTEFEESWVGGFTYDNETFKGTATSNIELKSGDYHVVPFRWHDSAHRDTGTMAKNLNADGNYYHSPVDNPAVDVDFSFLTPTTISSYIIRGDYAGYTDKSPKAWKLLGSNDTIHWYEVDSRDNETNWGGVEERVFHVETTKRFQHYRLAFTESNGTRGLVMYRVWIGTTFEERQRILNKTYGIYSGKYAYDNDDVFRVVDMTGGARGTYEDGNARTFYRGACGIELSNTYPSYSSSGNYMMAYMFDGTYREYDHTEYYLSSSYPILTFDLTKMKADIDIQGMRFFPSGRWNSNGRTNFKFHTSKDGVTWENVTQKWCEKLGYKMLNGFWDSQDINEMQAYEDFRYFPFTDDEPFNYLKVETQRHSSYATINEIEFVYTALETIADLGQVETEIHKRDVAIPIRFDRLTGSDITGAKYKITVNGQQAYPEGGSMQLPDNLPFEVTHVVPWKFFKIGLNILRIEIDEGSGFTSTDGVNITRLNYDPVITADISAERVHKDNVVVYVEVSDFEKDKVKFKMYRVEGETQVPLYPKNGDWTPDQVAPLIVNQVIRNSDLDFGINDLVMAAMDENGAETQYAFTVDKFNTAPDILNPAVKGKTVYADIEEQDGDQVGYRILVDGEKKFPATEDWTKLAAAPMSIRHTLGREDVTMGQNNQVTIEVIDDVGEVSVWTQDVLIDYVGVLFTDEEETLYSTDIGEVVKLLDVGKILAGETSDIYPVWLKNNTGFALDNVRLWVDNKELDEPDEMLKLCAVREPFEPSDTLEFPDRMEFGDKFQFFVRLDTTRKAIGGGEFDIYVAGDPV